MRMGKPTCKAKTRRGTLCKCKPVKPGGRCRLHGGASTGPRTVAGKAQCARNLEAARAFLASDDPRAVEARRLRTEKATATKARNRAIRLEAAERERRRAEYDATWRAWCAQHRFDPITMRRIPRSP